MASNQESVSMAVFCDFENVALGVRDAKYEKFDIKPILERLLLKGSIVVKKAYCDWERYKGFKAAMHEANFELIEIPHVRQSGKNSADIRLVVDALDLCYTKSHVDTFVIISGDSDFSPLVSKLRENAKRVIGVGVKQSTSDLLVANCDDFIFYDDLVRESEQTARKRHTREAAPVAKRAPDEERNPREELEKRRAKGIAIAVETFDALVSERGDSGKIWASVLKEAIKRRRPDFNETYFGFRAFGNLLEAAQTRGLLEFGRDEKSGAYVYRSHAGAEAVEATDRAATAAPARQHDAVASDDGGQGDSRRKQRGGRQSSRSKTPPVEQDHEFVLAPDAGMPVDPVAYLAAAQVDIEPAPVAIPATASAAAVVAEPMAPATDSAPASGVESPGTVEETPSRARAPRSPRKSASKSAAGRTSRTAAGRRGADVAVEQVAAPAHVEAPAVGPPPAEALPARSARGPRNTTRSRRPRKSEGQPEG